jgi:hypothetical protein
MTTAERVALSGMPTGFSVFDTSDGNIYYWNGTWNGLSTSSNPAISYDVDFTTQAVQNFKAGGDGNYTIDGKTWTVANTANATTFAIGATGLGGSADGGGWGGGGFLTTLPMIYCQLTQLIPNLSIDARLRFRCYVDVSNLAASYECFYMVVGPTKASMFGQTHHIGKGGTGVYIQSGSYYANTLQYLNQSTNFADDVLMVDVPTLGGSIQTTYTGVYAAGWPTAANMHARGQVSNTNGSAVVPSYTVSPGDVYFYLQAQPGAVIHPNWRVKRILIECWP